MLNIKPMHTILIIFCHTNDKVIRENIIYTKFTDKVI